MENRLKELLKHEKKKKTITSKGKKELQSKMSENMQANKGSSSNILLGHNPFVFTSQWFQVQPRETFMI